jgi:hypothetical protein
MLPENNVYAVLGEILGPCIDKVPLDIFEFVINLPKDALFSVFRHLRDRRCGPRILQTQVVALLGPKVLQCLQYWKSCNFQKSEAILGIVFTKDLIEIEAQGLQLLVENVQSHHRLGHISPIKRVQAVDSEDPRLCLQCFLNRKVLNKVAMCCEAFV